MFSHDKKNSLVGSRPAGNFLLYIRWDTSCKNSCDMNPVFFMFAGMNVYSRLFPVIADECIYPAPGGITTQEAVFWQDAAICFIDGRTE